MTTIKKRPKKRLKGKVRVTERVHVKGRVYENVVDSDGKCKTRKAK